MVVPTVLITGWQPGLLKVSMTQSIQARARIGLREAKSVTDRVLDGEHVALDLPDAESAASLAHELRGLGATVVVRDDPA